MKRILLLSGGVFLLLFSFGLVFFLLLSPRPEPRENNYSSQRFGLTETPPASTAVEPDTMPKLFSRHDSTSGPKVAIVIDDLGWDPRTAKYYDGLEIPLTMALLPHRPRSDRFYNQWKKQYEFIIHMPMEPVGYPADDPGEGALMTSMDREEVQHRLREVFQSYPRAVGINNHMGSAFTRNQELMRYVMDFLAGRNLYYLDSGTTRNSQAIPMAEQFNVPAIQNQVFLDHKRTRDFVEGQLKHLVERARDHGYAIGIGHIQSQVTARVLREKLPEYQQKGVQFVPLSEIIGLPRLQARKPSEFDHRD